MSDAQSLPSNDVSAVRAALFDDLASVSTYAEATGLGVRTVERHIAQKRIPVTYIGRVPYIVVSRARETIMANIKCGHDPVRRGRPSNKAAA